jgi:restriction system protein
MNNTPIWVIRAGRNGEAHDLFVHSQQLALGRPEMGNLKQLNGTRESFKDAYTSLHPQDHPTGIATIASQLFRFVHEMKSGDHVVYPYVEDGKLYLGFVNGPYVFKADVEPNYPHRRKVRWIGSVEWGTVSQMAKNELRAAKSLFQVKRNCPEVLAMFGRAAESNGAK